MYKRKIQLNRHYHWHMLYLQNFVYHWLGIFISYSVGPKKLQLLTTYLDSICPLIIFQNKFIPGNKLWLSQLLAACISHFSPTATSKNTDQLTSLSQSSRDFQGQFQGLAQLIRFSNGPPAKTKDFSEWGNKNAFLMSGHKDKISIVKGQCRDVSQLFLNPYQLSISDSAVCCVWEENRPGEKGPFEHRSLLWRQSVCIF